MTVCKSIIKEIKDFMKLNGFDCKKQCFYKIHSDMAFCVELEAPSGLVYINCYVIPLYLPTEFRHYTYGVRLNITFPNSCSEGNSIEMMVQQLKHVLSFSIFPSFNEITSPHVLCKLVNTKKLFNPHAFRITNVHIQRLLLYTALYERSYNDIQLICEKYRSSLIETTTLSSIVKDALLEEIRSICNLVTNSDHDVDVYLANNITESKLKCFGLKQ